VMGFGTFPGVPSNPAQHLALALNGRTVGDRLVVGEGMPVSYERCVRRTRTLVASYRPELLLGVGVATERRVPSLERTARNRCDSRRVDVDAIGVAKLVPGGPDVLHTDFVSKALCDAIDGELSDNAGDYVCNAWLYDSLRLFSALRVGFLHLPAHGIDANQAMDLLRRGLENNHAEG